MAVSQVVDDGVNPAVSATMTLSVYADACDATRNGAGLGAGYPGDFDGNCIINLADLAAEIAPVWIYDYSLTDPIPE